MVISATALAVLCHADPWAESPALATKALDPSFSAVLSSEEILHRGFADPAPRTDERTVPDPGRWRWMGRAVPSLDPRTPDSSWHAGFGNELGDYLFRETTVENPENRNPALWFDASTPLLAGMRAGLGFDQVDHFSDRMLDLRASLLGNPLLTDQGPETRRSFFGENIPGRSFMEASVEAPRLASIAGRTGWIWLSSPGVGELQCWRATTVAGSLRFGSVEWSHAEGWFDRADTATGTLRQSQGWIAGGPVGDPALSARAGFAYGSIRRSGDVSWRPGENASLQPWLALSAHADDWHLGGSHQMGTDFFLLRDTIGWSTDLGAWTPSFQAAGQWTDRPDGMAPWTDSSSAGVARMASKALEQTYSGAARLRFRSGRISLSIGSEPWCVVHPHAFEPSAFAVFASAEEDWIVRAGSEKALAGVLWGWKSDASVDVGIAPWLSLDAQARFDPVLGGPQGQTDLVAPVKSAAAGLRLSHRSGFSLHPVVLWRDEAILRHRSSEDWIVSSGPDANLWLDQEYFEGRLVFSMAALNIFSRSPIQAPNASEDRTRLLVQIRARPF